MQPWNKAHRKTLEASFQMGLPTTANHLTRMSISESRALAEWMGPGGGGDAFHVRPVVEMN